MPRLSSRALRVVRRALSVTVATGCLVALAAMPAEARTCSGTFGSGTPFERTITYPCPGPQDQPVPAPVWIATDYGPGHTMPEWNWMEVSQGARVFLCACGMWSLAPVRLYGQGFDSGFVPLGTAREVMGVPDLPVGSYRMFNADDNYIGTLYVEPPAVHVGCSGPLCITLDS